jgi:anti-anti-sigma factor
MPAKVEIREHTAVIILSGELDFSSQEEIHRAINEALAVNAAGEIQVDLGNVTFMDSSVIQALLTLQEKANLDRKSLTLVNCRDHIREILTIGGFDHIFKIR